MKETIGLVGGGEACLTIKSGNADVIVNWSAVEKLAREAAQAIEASSYFTEQGAWCLALVRQSGAMEWQPIETAPKDGTLIWLARANPACRRLGFWQAERWADMAKAEQLEGRRDLHFEPTHWMHVPPPPGVSTDHYTVMEEARAREAKMRGLE